MAKMTEEQKEQKRQLMKEMWADPSRRKMMIARLKAARRKKTEVKIAKPKPRRPERQPKAQPPSPRELRRIANGNAAPPTKGIAARKLQERWTEMIVAELAAECGAKITAAANLAGIRPGAMTKQLVRLLRK